MVNKSLRIIYLFIIKTGLIFCCLSLTLIEKAKIIGQNYGIDQILRNEI